MRIIMTIVIVYGGFLVKNRLRDMRKAPIERGIEEPVRTVEVIAALPTDETVTITGYGNARSSTMVTVRPQVAGLIVNMHEQLDAGHLIKKDDVLLVIDPTDYELTLSLHLAEKKSIDAQFEAVYEDERHLRELKTLKERKESLTRNDWQRVQALFDESVRTQDDVSNAEKLHVQAAEEKQEIINSLNQIPNRLNELHAQRERLEALIMEDRLNISRCQILCPFNARVHQVDIELGDLLAANEQAAVLANDAELEISVPIEESVIYHWFPFGDHSRSPNEHWFRPTNKTPAMIYGANTDDPFINGYVDRVEAFDPDTRTIALLVKTSRKGNTNQSAPFNIVPGMFCRVVISGKTVPNVFRLPFTAVNEFGNLYAVVHDRLVIKSVNIVHRDGNDVIIDKGISAGDRIVVNKLAAAVDGMRVRTVNPKTDSR